MSSRITLERWTKHCLPLRVKILKTYCNDSLVALEKPVNYLSHPNSSKSANEDKVLIRGNYDLKKECFVTNFEDFGTNQNLDHATTKTYLLHRLDKATSGVMLVSRNKEIARKIKESFKEKRISKEYIALVFGRFPEKENVVWKDSYEKKSTTAFNGRTNASLNFSKQTAPISETKVSLITHMNQFNTSLIKLSPMTGFMNQLRYQCAIRGFPIVGDRVYGDFDLNKHVNATRMYLHASSLLMKVTDSSGKEIEVDVVSDLPDEFYQFDSTDKKKEKETNRKE